MTAFALNQADLAFVLKQIKIAEAHANGAALTEIRLNAAGEVITDPAQYHPETGAFLGDPALPRVIPDPHVPNGLRTVDGSYNNLIAGTGDLGRLRRADAAPLRAELRQRRRSATTMPFGPPGAPVVTNTNYGVTNGSPTDPNAPGGNGGHTGNVADADPRTISNLVVDMTINNPAALVAALAFAGISGGEALAIVGQVQALMEEARLAHAAVAGAVAAADAAVAAAQLVVDAATTAQADAQTAFDNALAARDSAAADVGAAEGALAVAIAAEAAQDAVIAAAQDGVTDGSCQPSGRRGYRGRYRERQEHRSRQSGAGSAGRASGAASLPEPIHRPKPPPPMSAAVDAREEAALVHGDAVEDDEDADAALLIARDAHADAVDVLQNALLQQISLSDAVESAQQALEEAEAALAGAEATLAVETSDLAAANAALADAKRHAMRFRPAPRRPQLPRRPPRPPMRPSLTRSTHTVSRRSERPW